ncbi:hypothetical protein HQO72_14995 [Rhodococcus fascians]|nr:hypothetical protein [Rhodococcus fascians]MBY3893249.1 hypothetical protein [Rhodococcus fascians]MBY4153853.1 hypothetical protein [Rhodococcus fascians]MBY4159094.1 hypothetical protein [Rhodococcus fascians]MBY4310090.1 hypothetical protein [Rhodococcus fascians]
MALDDYRVRTASVTDMLLVLTMTPDRIESYRTQLRLSDVKPSTERNLEVVGSREAREPTQIRIASALVRLLLREYAQTESGRLMIRQYEVGASRGAPPSLRCQTDRQRLAAPTSSRGSTDDNSALQLGETI